MKAVVSSIAAIVIFAITPAAWATESKEPAFVTAFDEGDFAKALRLARPLAEGGDALAEQIMGLCFGNGWGVSQDFGQAASWYEKAANQGWVAAENNLAALYVEGKGVPQDYAKAMFWYRKAADQGAAQAMYGIGRLYENGWGVPQDYKEAAGSYRKAADGLLQDWYRRNTPPH